MMNTNHIYPMVLIIGSLFAFLPIILNYHYSTQSDDDNIKDLDIQLKQSYNLHMAFVSSIAVMLPFLFEYLLEFLFLDHNSNYSR